MNTVRVIPALLLKGLGLVKTVQFKDPTYIGDPRNAVRIFNEREVDELAVFDILATPQESLPRFDLINEIISEAFMPVAYGGGIRDLKTAFKLLNLGVEKLCINSYAHEDPEFISQLARNAGSQSVVVCIDVRTGMFGRRELCTHGGRRRFHGDPVAFAHEMQERGAGEIIITSVNQEGTMRGFDLELTRSVAQSVSIPVLANGGAGSLEDIARAVHEGGASGVTAGSMFVYYGRNKAVLINYPDRGELIKLFV